jgi:N-dimethylarginine dimethylaminohydrolase
VARLSWGHRYLVTEPRHFTVFYRINPWMVPTVDGEAAMAQWKEAVGALERAGAEITTTADVDGLPDMAFTMNAGFVAGNIAVPSRFRHAERQPEEPHWRAWFAGAGYDVVELPAPEDVRFEAGDAFLVDDVLVAAHGFRSDAAAPAALAEVLDRPVVAVRLVDDRFYHFDTCFCPLGDGRALVYPGAIAPDDLGRLLEVVPDAFLLTEDEAVTFCANSAVVGDAVVMSGCPPRVRQWLRDAKFEVEVVDLSEFHKSGGGVRCLTLPLDVPGRTP